MSSASLLYNGQVGKDLSLGLTATSPAAQTETDMNMVSSYKDLCLSKMDSIKMNEDATGHLIRQFGSDYDLPLRPELRRDLAPEVRDLILVHLDIIQQQSELLNTKDKMISDLQTDNETLRQKISRMERRVHLNRQKARSSLVVENGICSSQESSGTDICLSLESQVKKRRRRSSEGSLRAEEPVGKRQLRSRREDEGARSDALTTNITFYTCVGDSDCDWAVELPPLAKTNLEVPKWRVKVYTSSSSTEDVENTSSDVYDRRHIRLLMDEKRRKRWDVQRIREQRHNEKLRQREERSRKDARGESEDLPASFFPPLDKINTLSVIESLPVSFCGIPIQNEQADFSLPELWRPGKEQSLGSKHRRGKR